MDKIDPLKIPAVDVPIPPAVVERVATASDVLIELSLATSFLILIIAVHGWLLTQASGRFSRRFALMDWRTPMWKINLVMSVTVATLVAIHLTEAAIWASPLYFMHITRDFRDAYSYVLEAYTTLGEGRVVLPDKYRLLAPVIAVSGLFTFGWTGSALVYVMTQVLRLEATRARRKTAGKDIPMDDFKGPFGTGLPHS